MALTLRPACPLCQGERGRPVWTGAGRGGVRQVMRCHDCGVAYNHPPTDKETLTAWYSDTYFGDFYGGDRQVATVRQQPLVATAAARLGGRPGRLLDIGCGVGDLCVAAQEAGWDAVGVELSAAAAGQAADRGVKVIKGPADAVLGEHGEAVPLLAEHFDVVVFRDALVHMPQAALALAGARRHLQPGGWLAVRVPNRHPGVFAAARLAARFVDASGILHLPAQVFHLDRPSLAALLARQGLVDVEVTGESEMVAVTGGRYSSNRVADLVWRLLVWRWQQRGEDEALWGWGRQP